MSSVITFKDIRSVLCQKRGTVQQQYDSNPRMIQISLPISFTFQWKKDKDYKKFWWRSQGNNSNFTLHFHPRWCWKKL